MLVSPTKAAVAALCGAFALLGAPSLRPLPAEEAQPALPPAVTPGAAWESRPPGELGLAPARLEELRALVKGTGCVIRRGYLAFSWGEISRRIDVASAAKPVYAYFLLLAVEEGKLSLDDRVAAVEPGLERLNGPLGFKDRQIRWRHLASQTSCYGSLEKPGEAFDYNDWNMALLADVLFLRVYRSSWEKVDAEVLRPRLADPLGCQDRPTFLAFGAGDRAGRLAISPRDFARFGLLYLRKGEWMGKRLIREESVRTALASPLPSKLPRTLGKPAEMLPGQRSIGGGRDQTDHFGSYSLTWWTNGVDREGKRHWHSAPLDAVAALGHGGNRALILIPSLDIVLSWNDSPLEGREAEDRAIGLLAAAAGAAR